MRPLLPLLALLGCSARQPVGGVYPAQPARPWPRVYGDWTRDLKLYDGFETALLMQATLWDAPLRQAWSAELAWRRALDVKAALVADLGSQAEAGAGHEVVFSAQRMEGVSREFGLSDADPWRVALDVNGRPCTPESIARVSDPSPADAARWLQANAWSDLWVARFQTDCGASGEVTLKVTGVHGRGELSWSLGG